MLDKLRHTKRQVYPFGFIYSFYLTPLRDLKRTVYCLHSELTVKSILNITNSFRNLESIKSKLKFIGANYLIYSATQSKSNKKIAKTKANTINWIIDQLE